MIHYSASVSLVVSLNQLMTQQLNRKYRSKIFGRVGDATLYEIRQGHTLVQVQEYFRSVFFKTH